MEGHRIRLAYPWNFRRLDGSSGVLRRASDCEPWRDANQSPVQELSRTFHRPTGLQASSVWLCLPAEGPTASITLNGADAPPPEQRDGSAYVRLEPLSERNTIAIELRGDARWPTQPATLDAFCTRVFLVIAEG